MQERYELIEKAYESDDREEVQRLTKQVLQNDPNDKEALFLLADTLEDPAEQLMLLERAYAISARDFEAAKIEEDDDPLDFDEGMVHAGIIQRLIIPLTDMGRGEEAVKLARELRAIDPENQIDSHTLYYFALLKLEDYSHTLEETMSDDVHSLAWAWTRFICVFMLSGGDAAEKNFDEAVNMSPNVPFYMSGKYEEPVDESETEEEDFSFSLLFSEIVSADEELTKWFVSKIAEMDS